MSKPVLGALLTALLLRLAWGIAIPVLPVSDSHAYDVFAQNIAQGHGYGWEPGRPSAYWPVGTSALYAVFFWLFGHGYTPIMLFQALEGVAIVALAMSLARRWFGEPHAIVTGWLLACWPLLIQYTTVLASELHFLLLVLLAFQLASLHARDWVARALLSGVALAAASYVRPLALIMAPLVFIRDALDTRRWVRAFVACCVAGVATAACIAPWSLRNWDVFDRFVLISTNGGTNLWMGNNASGSIAFMSLPKLDIPNEADRDRFLGKEARDYIVKDPVAFAVRAARKVVNLHDRETIGVTWNERGITQRLGAAALTPLKLASSLYWWMVLALAAYGTIRLACAGGFRSLAASPPVIMWGYFTLFHAITVAGDRYHIPSVPFIAMIAAYALCTWWAARQTSSAPAGHR